jgi:hypothetical protein
MGLRRDATCPLCGARLSAEHLLDCCGEFACAALDVLEARCPHCQGYLEVQPVEGQLRLGYHSPMGAPRFDAVIALALPGLTLERTVAGVLRVVAAERAWEFA